MKLTAQKIGLVAGPLAFLLTLWIFHPAIEDVKETTSIESSEAASAILATTLWMAIWWLTEAVPIAVTALLPIILFPLTGGMKIEATTASFGHKYVFLYIGGFILAVAIEKWNLHKRIALSIISIIGTNINLIILGFMIATAFLSMWISNTATSVMMLPIGMAIISQLKDNPDTIANENEMFGKALMLAIAYSASIGGVATLVGTPPNLVLAGIVEKTYNIEIGFGQWMMFGLPISLLLLFICWQYLVRFAFKFEQTEFPGGREEINRQLKLLGKISYEEKWVLAVFSLTALTWIIRRPIFNELLGIKSLDDTIIAMSSAVILFLLPAGKKSQQLLNWKEAVQIPWGIILLFGGGLALASGFVSSGLASWIGTQLNALGGLHILLLIFILIAAVNFLTEITSNLATTSMLLPILAPMALSMDVHPFLLMVGATVAASCAFMLPVATPPNAVVFGSGYLRIPDMVRSGVWMNILSILLITAFVYLLLPMLWGFEYDRFPESLKGLMIGS